MPSVTRYPSVIRYGVAIRIALVVAMMGLLPPSAYAQSNGLFGSREIHSTNMKAFGKWSGVWRRQNLQRADTEADAVTPANDENRCRGRGRLKCSREAWDKFIDDQRIKGSVPADASGAALTVELLEAVNLYFNRSTYIVDPVNWGVPDYWSTPDEFFLKDGDCEDYAISKFITLKRMGIDTAKMRLVILQDENLRAAHAVLAVELEDTYYILDNQVDTVLTHDKILHYRPVYSINESNWWLHQVKRFGR